MKFTNGKWYRWRLRTMYEDTGSKILYKLDKVEDKKFYYSESILGNGRHQTIPDTTDTADFIELTPEEIEKWLPEGHIDKLPKTIEYEIY